MPQAQHGDGVLIFGQGEQQVFEGGVFMVEFVGVVQRLMRVFEGFDNMASRLLQGTLQRMLVLTSKIHDLGDFGFRDFVGEDTANADPFGGHAA